jgi:hypothetical protein
VGAGNPRHVPGLTDSVFPTGTVLPGLWLANEGATVFEGISTAALVVDPLQRTVDPEEFSAVIRRAMNFPAESAATVNVELTAPSIGKHEAEGFDAVADTAVEQLNHW